MNVLASFPQIPTRSLDLRRFPNEIMSKLLILQTIWVYFKDMAYQYRSEL